jgi:hypothetical protein
LAAAQTHKGKTQLAQACHKRAVEAAGEAAPKPKLAEAAVMALLQEEAEAEGVLQAL